MIEISRKQRNARSRRILNVKKPWISSEFFNLRKERTKLHIKSKSKQELQVFS